MQGVTATTETEWLVCARNVGELREVAPTFANMVDAELRLKERNIRVGRKQGGYYKILYPDGGQSTIHSGRECPLDEGR